ncbi:MAG TPA: hypothetical protein VE615_06225 [Gaiellaceae bacterium]|nr:hypothetical protein [Gaiellaceae bacterium]
MRLVEQWREILGELPSGWGRAQLRLTLEDAGDGARAAAVLAPVTPARRGTVLNFYAARRESGALPELVMRLLARLDREGIRGRLELLRTDEGEVEAALVEQPVRSTLAAEWDELVGALPPDWSDLYGEIELTSTDYLERAALLLAPVNPARYGGPVGFRFRVARRFGYGASPEMTRRCLERLDQEAIRGHVRILRALSDTKPVATQGPVWYVGGRSV